MVEKAETTLPADRRAAAASNREPSECIFLDLLPRFMVELLSYRPCSSDRPMRISQGG